MIKVNEQYITAEVSEIITELSKQLAINGIKRFYKSIDTPKNYMVCCPFHKEGQERKPSMGILKSDGTCHCFACGWVGSISEMISNCFGYDDMGVFGSKWLIKNFLTLQVEERKDIELDVERKNSRNSNSISNSNYSGYIGDEELDKYRYTHPYWAKRGITDEYIIELFDLGYDKETDCITFPIRDIDGNCLFIARRSVRTKYFHYPNGVSKPLYGLYELNLKYKECVEHRLPFNYFPNEVIVCESMLDALTCWQYGRYAVALNGLGNDLQFKQLKEMPCRHLILATDNDDAGMRARMNIAYNVNNKLITQYVLPEGKKDINELTKDEFYSLQEIFI